MQHVGFFSMLGHPMDLASPEANLCRAAQDIVFVVQQIPDPIFDREGNDLIVHVSVYLSVALTEGKIDVPHLDGRTLRVPLKEVSWLPPNWCLDCSSLSRGSSLCSGLCPCQRTGAPGLAAAS